MRASKHVVVEGLRHRWRGVMTAGVLAIVVGAAGLAAPALAGVAMTVSPGAGR
jgi:uncharacterized membrane protein HdeD (DUF308 family)